MRKSFWAMIGLAATLLFSGCGGGDGGNAPADSGNAEKLNASIKVGATAVPHAEILENIKSDLADKGVTMEIVEFNDYVQPNIALNDKELDANFFQHEPYLDDFMKEHSEIHLKNAGGVHIEPMGIYSSKLKMIGEVPFGGTVAIPNDPTNGGRALLLLEKADLITLREGAGAEATVQDIISNNNDLTIQEIEAAQLPRTLDDVDIAVINTNFAMNAGLNPTQDALFMEDSTSPYVNVIAVRDGEENTPEIKALVDTVRSDKTRKFIEEKYNGAIVPAF